MADAMTPGMGPSPTRKTDERTLDQWNVVLRSSPIYIEFMKTIGVDPNGRIKLSGDQQEAFEKFLAARGVQIPKGMHIDSAGNLNQKNSLWKNLAKGAAIGGGIAATVFGIPGLTPGLLGGGGAGAAGAAGAGITPGAVGAPTFFGTATGTGLLSPAAFAAGGGAAAAGAGGVLPATFGAGYTGLPAATGGAVGTGTTAASGGGGILGGLKGLLKSPGDALGLAGDMLGGAADTMAHNRGVRMDAQSNEALMKLRQEQQYRDSLVQREQEGRASGSDAWRKLQAAEYVAGRNKDYTPATVSILGQSKQLPSYGFGPKASTENEKLGAAGLGGEAMKRLQGGNPIPEVAAPTPFKFDDVDPSTGERVTDWLGTGLSIWGGLRGNRGGTGSWRDLVRF